MKNCEMEKIKDNIANIANNQDEIYKKQNIKRDAFLNASKNQNKISKMKASIRAAQLIHKLRKKAGLTQAEIADKLSMKQPNYARIEKGQNITVNTLADIANVCGAEIDIQCHFKHV